MNDDFSPSYSAPDNGENFHPIPLPDSSSSDSASISKSEFDLSGSETNNDSTDFDLGFYGSYGDAVNIPDLSDSGDESFAPVLDYSVSTSSQNNMPSEPSDSFVLPVEDLTIPDMPAPVSDPSRTTKKSMGYETTVKIKNARHAERDEKRINEPIRKNERPNYAPKEREFNGIASGTAHVSGGLPELKDNQMYVAVTPKELRRLKSRKFRGLGVFCALCLGIIASFCIWSYVNSFADPIVGRWKGNISSLALGIDSIKELDQDEMASTWEFSGSGTLYVNLVINDTPVSLSGSYSKKSDKDGEQYVSMTLKSPVDNADYTVDMYYTVTGDILQFNDMDGVGAEIDLTKE